MHLSSESGPCHWGAGEWQIVQDGLWVVEIERNETGKEEAHYVTQKFKRVQTQTVRLADVVA